MTNRSPPTLALLAICFGLTGCAKFLYGRDIDWHARVTTAQQKVSNHQSEYGHLAHGVPVADLEREPTSQTWGGSDRRSFIIISMDPQHICFETRARVGNEVEVKRQVMDLTDNHKLVVTAHASLDEITESTPWPAGGGPGTIDSVQFHPNSAQDRRNGGPDSPGEPTIEFCGPTPAISDATNYIILSVMPAGEPENNQIAIWDFAGTAKPAADEQ